MNLKKELLALSYGNLTYNKCWKYLSLRETQLIEHFDDFIQLVAEQADFLQLKQSQMNKIESLADGRLLEAWSKTSIGIGERAYPSLWYQLPQPPLLFFYQGALDLLNQPLITIVGTRQVSEYGVKACQEIVEAVIDQGWICVSGLAKGVDAVVHRACLAKQDKSTIAIVPTGLDQVYPNSHKDLQQALGQRHLLISEYLPNQTARKHHFIMRNRLLAGISPVTIIIEAAHKSGSLITANYALQANREIFALPGRITDTQALGCNQLIEAGARPIVSIEGLINDIQELFQYQKYTCP